MASGNIWVLVLCALFAIIATAFADVATQNTATAVEDGGYHRRHCRYGCCKYYHYGGCFKCCGYAAEVPEAALENNPTAATDGGYNKPHYCRYGCCKHYRYGGGCYKCCGYATEAPEATFQEEVN